MERALGLLVALVLVPALGRHEDLAALQARGSNGEPHPGLVAVRRRGVDVPVAGGERRGDRLLRLGRWYLEDPEAELRDVRSARQGDPGLEFSLWCHWPSMPRRGGRQSRSRACRDGRGRETTLIGA